jgi:hypothetical protein
VLAELNKNAPKESLAQPAPSGDSELTPK